jgi:hypothetical protein
VLEELMGLVEKELDQTGIAVAGLHHYGYWWSPLWLSDSESTSWCQMNELHCVVESTPCPHHQVCNFVVVERHLFLWCIVFSFQVWWWKRGEIRVIELVGERLPWTCCCNSLWGSPPLSDNFFFCCFCAFKTLC